MKDVPPKAGESHFNCLESHQRGLGGLTCSYGARVTVKATEVIKARVALASLAQWKEHQPED